MSHAEFLQGQLERLFELEGMLALSRELLGLEPSLIGGTNAKGTFARALVQHCEARDDLLVLAEAIRVSARERDDELAPLPSAEELASGTALGEFRIVRALDTSALHTSYLAEYVGQQPGLPPRAEVKVYHRERTRDRLASWRLLSTARALMALREPGLCAILDAGTLADGRAYLVSEALEGQTLTARLTQRGPIHFSELRGIARTFLHGLAALHARSVVHGALSADHLWLVKSEANSREPSIGVLSELATAALLDAQEEALPLVLRIVGDPTTLAPEVARGEPQTPVSEVYAAGCLLYRALTGRPVFQAASPIEHVVAHLYEEPEPPSECAPPGWVSPEFDEVILRALRKDPGERYQSARQLAEALTQLSRSSLPPRLSLSQRELARASAALLKSPSDPLLAVELEAVVAPSGHWHEALAVLRQAAHESAELGVKKQLLFRCARILVDELEDRTAAEQAYRSVLALDANDEQAQHAIEELRRESRDHAGLVELLLARLGRETSPEARAAILCEVAVLYENELARPGSALEAWAQALSEDPNDERARRGVERLATRDAQLEDVITLLESARSARPEQPAHALGIAVLVADWYTTRLARLELALRALEQALRLDPAHEPALEALALVYRKSEAWDDLVRLLLRRAAAAATPTREREYKLEAAGVLLHKLGDVELAERTFLEVLAEDPAHPTAVAALEELYAAEGELTKLVGLLERKAGELRGTARAEALCELAELLVDEADSEERALTHYRAALDADERCLAAYRGLERIFAAQKRHHELLAVLERERAIVTTSQQRIALLERLGMLYEELAETAHAAECFEQIIELMPAHERANAALARLYRVLHRFDDLAQTYDRHAKGVEEPARKVELLMQAARVLMADLGSPERAAFVCERVLSVAPAHPEALSLIARIRALAGDTLAALDAIELLADTEQDARERSELWVRAGQMLEEHDDLDGAIERFQLALASVPSHPLALEALGRLYARRGDVRGEVALLERRVELTEDPRERAARLVALGRARLEKLNEPRLAGDAFHLARDYDPENREALLGLGKLALALGRWEESIALLEPVLEHESSLPSELTRQLWVDLGDCHRQIGELALAERAYLRARGYLPETRVVQERLLELALESERYEDAAMLIGALLLKEGASLSVEERQALLMKLGRAREELGQLERAQAAYTTASELAPEQQGPLKALARVFERAGNVAALEGALRGSLALERDPEPRFALLIRLGELALERRDRRQAARYFVSALELNADDRNLLSKLMAVYSESKDWSRLVEVLVRLARVVEEPRLCAKYLYTAAGISHKELLRLDDAAEYYETALSLDPTLESAFKGLVECLTKRAAFERLATVYRKHLARRQHELDDDALAALWSSLGELYLTHMQRVDAAVECLERAHELAPGDRARLERLVDVYGRQPRRFAERAIAAHARLLATTPYRVESYRALRRLYTELSRPDEAWAVCQALRSLNMADPDEETFFKRHRVQAPARALECITEALWQEFLLLPEQDQALTAIFALVQGAAIQDLAQAPEDFAIARDRPVDCERDPAVMAQMLHYGASVMLVPLPPVFYRPRDPFGVSFLFTSPPALGLGQGALRESPDQALAFMAGRQLSYFRPGHYMRQLVPTGGGLRSWLLAAFRLANGRFPVPSPMRAQVERNHAALVRTLHAPEQQALVSLVERLLREQPELDTKRWALALDLLADRVGFVLANSLDAAVAVVRASPAGMSFASERDRLKALYQYAVSPKYLSLRRALGVALGS